jgi:hypothetical protein
VSVSIKDYLLSSEKVFFKKYLITIRDVDRWISIFLSLLKEENGVECLWVNQGELLGSGVCE